MKTLTTLALSFVLFLSSYSQAPSIGLRYNSGDASDGYTLFTPQLNKKVYLINNCGEVINDWEFSEKPGATCYLLENGNLLRAGKDSLEIRDWNNNLIWSYAMNLNGYLQHHDIEPLPNGNILCILSDKYTYSDAVDIGKDPNLSDPEQGLKLDKIIELQPVGINDANLVWEWKFVDHLIQEFDETKNNYGDVSEHPELLDINFMNDNEYDYTHVNGIDYNPELDQIIISARHTSEVYIIDHSTTTSEAASHSGGNSGKGGDFLWRWGNPQVYQGGTVSDQKLFLQHDPKWVNKDYANYGKISVFNNGGDGTDSYSSIHLINPIINNDEYEFTNEIFAPSDFDWSWNGNILGETMLEGKKSGTKALPNGNFIICETSKGQITEINEAGDVLWVYKNPSGLEIHNQGDIPIDNSMFRAEKYPPSFIGFSNVDLEPKNIIEDSNSISEECIATSIQNITSKSYQITNPVSNEQIQFNQNVEFDQLVIYNCSGVKLIDIKNFRGNKINFNFKTGLYIMKTSVKNITNTSKIIKI
jgi:hypothetical protein